MRHPPRRYFGRQHTVRHMAHITKFVGKVAVITSGGLKWDFEIQGDGQWDLPSVGGRVGAAIDNEVRKLLGHESMTPQPIRAADERAPLPTRKGR